LGREILVIYPGVALAFAVWWSWIACVAMVVGYIWLTAYEDGYLVAHLPGYREYQQQTRYRWISGGLVIGHSAGSHL
jgi:protein-S-isoprenylcysteine O-methyltransferase Ste14